MRPICCIFIHSWGLLLVRAIHVNKKYNSHQYQGWLGKPVMLEEIGNPIEPTFSGKNTAHKEHVPPHKNRQENTCPRAYCIQFPLSLRPLLRSHQLPLGVCNLFTHASIRSVFFSQNGDSSRETVEAVTSSISRQSMTLDSEFVKGSCLFSMMSSFVDKVADFDNFLTGLNRRNQDLFL